MQKQYERVAAWGPSPQRPRGRSELCTLFSVQVHLTECGRCVWEERRAQSET